MTIERTQGSSFLRPRRVHRPLNKGAAAHVWMADWRIRERCGARPALVRQYWGGLAEEVALAERDTEPHQLIEFALGFDTLRDQLATGVTGEVSHAGDHGLAGRVCVDVADEGDVQLH